MDTIDLMDQFSHLGEGGIRNNGTLNAEVMFQPSLRTMRTDFIQVKAGDSIVYKNMSGMSSIWNILSFYTGDAQGFYVSGIAGQTTPQSGVWTAQQDGYVRLFGSFPAGDNISVTMTDLAPDVEDYLSQYNAMNYRFLPNSIPKIVAHIQEYLVDHPIADSTTLQAVIDAAFESYMEEIQETADTYIAEAVPPAAAAAVDAAAAPALAEITAKTAEAAESARQAGLSQQSAEMSEENALTYRNQAQQIKDSISAEVAASVLAAQEQATLAQESAQAADESADTAEQFVAQARSQAEAAANQAQTASGYASDAQGYMQDASGFAQNASDFADNAAQSAATFSTDPTLTISGKAADAKATGDELSALKSALSFYGFGLFSGRIDWDTVNKNVKISNGFFIYAGGYLRLDATGVTVSYDSFDNTTALVYDGSSWVFTDFRHLGSGYALALFNADKMYTPYDYSKVYVNGQKITTTNIFNDFASFVDAVDTKVDAVVAKADAVNAKFDTLFPEEIIYNQNNSKRSTAPNDNVWIIDELLLSPGTLITTIDAYMSTSGQKSFSVSFWNATTGEKYFDEDFTLTPVHMVATIPINYKVNVPTKIGFYSTTGFITVASMNGHNLLYVAPSATNLSSAQTLRKFVINATIKAIVMDSDDSPVLTQEIHVGEGLLYTEIQEALDSLSTDYATIIVHPKETPYQRFSLMRSLNGAYPWSGLATVKHISIIGIDKSKCIVQSDTGNYNTPPAEIATNGIIKNLTFIATHTASDGTETTGSYAVHVDNRPRDENGMKLIFENCDFISYQTAAVGLGLYRNQDILFDRCNFQSHTDSTWKPSENYDSAYMCRLGAYFMHTTMGYAGGNMFVRFRDCFFHHTGGRYAMVINDGDSEKTAYLEAINNTLYCEGTLVSNNMMLRPWNHGNSADAINAN